MLILEEDARNDFSGISLIFIFCEFYAENVRFNPEIFQI